LRLLYIPLPIYSKWLKPVRLRRAGFNVLEYSEAEQLYHEALEDERGHFRQGDHFRRVMTFKVLPERVTDYFASELLLSLALDVGGVREPVP